MGDAPVSDGRVPPNRLRRRVPRLREHARLVAFEHPFPGHQSRLERAQTIGDLRALANRRAPRVVFDYVDGGADAEIALARTREAFANTEFRPTALRDVSSVDTTRRVLGRTSQLPFAIAPTGFTRLMHACGEIAVARVAADCGIPFTLATMGTTSIEDLADASESHARNWFQLYIWKDRGRCRELVHRAAAAGYDTLVITIDTPVAGMRVRDVRNGMRIPPAIRFSGALDAVRRPRWWWDFLTTDPLVFASLDHWHATAAELADSLFDASVTYDDLAQIQAEWPGTVLVKGVQNVDDAKRLAALGVDGIVLSNHGGRQLDRAPVPLDLLPRVLDMVGGEVEVHLDSGITHGADILTAVAFGARSTLIGRAYLYGLMAGGEPGVRRAIEILRSQLIRTMKLLGVTTLDEVGPRHVQRLHCRRTSLP